MREKQTSLSAMSQITPESQLPCVNVCIRSSLMKITSEPGGI